MALVKCKECGKEISTEAATCPNCGAPHKASKSGPGPLKIIWYIACGVVLLVVFRTCYQIGDVLNKTDLGDKTTPSAGARCSVAAIQIKSMRARFENACSASRPCYSLKGVAVMTNGCPESTGVQIKITGLDSSGAPVASRDLWPASVSNIPPGDYTFSLDHYLDHDARIKSFTIQPITVK